MANRILKYEPHSTSIKHAEFDLDTNVLTIVFRQKTLAGRDTYKYAEVPKREWDGLTSATSVGSYVKKKIVGKYSEVVAEDEATRGRAALKLLEELLDERDQRLPYNPTILSTGPTFDKGWLPRVRKVVGR